MGFVNDVFRKIEDDMANKTSSTVSKKLSDSIDKKTQKGNGCPKCGKPISIGGKFCASCGAKLFITCLGCNKDYPFSTKFCPQCGKSLKA